MSSIRNKNIIPDTHYFLYKDKKYPFKFDFFKYASDYFSFNQEKYQLIKSIQLVDSETENIQLTEESIQLFINYVQGEEVILSNDNVFPIHFLSKKYEVKSLQNFTKEYITDHHKELIIELLQTDMQNSSIGTDGFEVIISANLIDHIQDDRLLNLPIPTLYRILSKYKSIQKVQKSDEDKEKVVEFCFKCLSKFGTKASSLFSHVDLENARNEHLNRLLTDYSNVFDFHFINSSLLRTLYKTNSELIRRDKENEKFRSDAIDMMSKMRDDVTKCLQKIEEQEKEIQSRKQEIEKEKSDHNDEISTIKGDVTKCLQKIEEQEKEIEKIKSDHKSEIKALKDEIIQLQTKLSQINDTHSSEGIPLLHEQRGDFNGIIKYLTDKKGGNIHDNGTIEVTSNSFQS